MAVKTITIDMEAYNLLSKLKKSNESFSQVIKKTLLKESKTAQRLMADLDRIAIAADTIERIEELVGEREKSYTDSPIINKR
jgi:predicted CopG family antitoxin